MQSLAPSPQRVTPQQAASELLARRRIRADFGAWCEYVLAPQNQTPARHHRLLIERLQQVESGAIDRLMVLMPPGSAKSTYASVLFAAWFLARQPERTIIGASHTADLADAFSRRAMALVREYGQALGCRLVTESVAAWETTNGSIYKAAGVGGPITGRRADLVVIDDPVKSREDAESEAYRERAWRWYLGDVRTRLRPGGRIVLIMTRWHEDDLGGRLLQVGSDNWTILKLPAIAEENDPLGREPGEWLWADDSYGYAEAAKQVLAEYEASGSSRDWAALYQQAPRPLEGALFKTAMISTLEAAPVVRKTVRAWDLAATKAVGTRDPDWTAGVKLGRTAEGRFIVLDVVRLRGAPDEVEAAIVNTAAQDGHAVRVGLPQDPGQAGKQQILYLTRKLTGYTVESSPETGDKGTRAAPVASQMNVGNLSFVAAPWNRLFIDELAGFPSAAHDDQVDALSRAFAMLQDAPPMVISNAVLARAAIPLIRHHH